MVGDPRQLLRAMFDAAIGAASPRLRIPACLPPAPKGRTIVIGAGKASAAMAKAVEDLWPGPLAGIVVTRYGHAVPCDRIEIVEAAHPVPDENGHRAARRIMEMVRGLGPDDLVLALISGGGSSLLSLPAPGVTLEDKQAVNAALLRSGASIGEMNVVRKHLSSIKGGRLAAAAYPARLVTLVISDVPGDDPAVIASGPTVPDSSTFAEARAVLEKYAITEPRAAIEHLMRAAEETPKPAAPRLANTSTVIIATPQLSLEAAADLARSNGVTPLILGDAIEGEAREVGRVMAGIARQIALRGQPAPPPVVLLSGGETTVTVRGNGRGGRNVEFLLSLVVELGGLPGVFALAGDTDGVDGAEEIAGAIAAPDSLSRAFARGIDAKARLADNDGHSFFEALGDQIVTGPTLTNVNDFRAILITHAQERPAG
jgi:glycerate 2-kinase